MFLSYHALSVNFFCISARTAVFNAFLLSNRWEYHRKSYTAEKQILWYTFLDVTSITFDITGPKATEFGKITATQNNGHNVVQGHWRSQISALTESQYAASYQWTIFTSYLVPFPRYHGLFVEFLLRILYSYFHGRMKKNSSLTGES